MILLKVTMVGFILNELVPTTEPVMLAHGTYIHHLMVNQDDQ